MDAKFLKDIAAIRQKIHANPELGFHETKTQALIRDTLTAGGVPADRITPCAKTGLTVDIVGTGVAVAAASGAGAGAGAGANTVEHTTINCVAFRADMDCLPMPEDNPDIAYASTVPGCAHACGHDGHVASAVGAALLLQRAADKIPTGKSVRFLFQPAEEGPGGAEPMIAEGALETVDEVYGFHNLNMLPLGAVWVQPGVASAHCCDFEVTIHGAGGHGSSPHLARDPLHAAAMTVVAINSISGRSVSPFRSAVVSVCAINCGTTNNVIPDSATIKGTMRDFDPTVAALLQQRLKAVVESTAVAHNCTATVELDDSYPSIINSETTTPIVSAVATKLLGPSRVVGDVGGGMPGAEDFSYFCRERPGTFIQLGGFVDGRTKCLVPHQGAYNYEDDITPVAISMWVRLTEHRLGCALYPGDALGFALPDPPTDAAMARFKKMWS